MCYLFITNISNDLYGGRMKNKKSSKKSLCFSTIGLSVGLVGFAFASNVSAQAIFGHTQILSLFNEMADSTKVIYGKDNRLEVHQAPQAQQKIAASTAAMIPNDAIKISEDTKTYNLNTVTLNDSKQLCEDQRFRDQITPVNCSGFLVGKDLLVTAGHCISTKFECEGSKWVFGIDVDKETGKASSVINKKDVYKCNKVISSAYSWGTDNDYSLIQLDRVVEDRTPLKYRTEGSVSVDDEIYVIGHPSGLPSKVSGGAIVRENEAKEFFVTNLDTFGGNSGSAVFSQEENTIEGILVRGETDYEFDFERGCRVVMQCEDDTCRGEDVTRISMIKELVLNKKLEDAIKAGNITEVTEIILAKYNLDMYNEEGKTALVQALEANQIDIAKLIINADADINLSIRGMRTPLDIATELGSIEIYETLKEKHNIIIQDLKINELSLIANAVGLGKSFELINYLISEGANINDTYDGKTLLAIAIETDKAALLNVLIDGGADINTLSNGRSILYTAITKGKTEVAIALINKGADVDTTANGKSALYLSIEKGQFNVAYVLISNKADVNTVDLRTKNPLIHLLIETNSEILLKKVISKVDLKQTNVFGVTPKKLAKILKKKAILKVIRKQLRKRRLAKFKVFFNL
ncbi:MAG: ankyrin repeat protein/V8-like Glu-specific endopeptidase [Thermoproteota archaeon]|jgi:ankyrin repeat protein/V8-like Glu-specific endopeptidase